MSKKTAALEAAMLEYGRYIQQGEGSTKAVERAIEIYNYINDSTLQPTADKYMHEHKAIPLPIYPVQDEGNLYKISYKYEEAMLHKFAPEILECVAKAIWDWEHDNRQNAILDVEWGLMRCDYLCRAQVALTAYNDIIGK